MPDEIIKELWKIKDTIAEEYGWDLNALVAHLKNIERGAGQQPVDLRGTKLASFNKTLKRTAHKKEVTRK